jgi:hypothetical protein
MSLSKRSTTVLMLPANPSASVIMVPTATTQINLSAIGTFHELEGGLELTIQLSETTFARGCTFKR